MLEGAHGTAGAAGQLVELYLRAVAGQDWESVERCLSPSVVRHGPFGDDFEGTGDYMEFLRRTMPSLPGYRMDIDRVTETDEGQVFVELRETIEVEGVPVVTEECLVFALDAGRVARVSIYIRHIPGSRSGRVVGSAR